MLRTLFFQIWCLQPQTDQKSYCLSDTREYSYIFEEFGVMLSLKKSEEPNAEDGSLFPR